MRLCVATNFEPDLSDWIRPEDLQHYETLGYDGFKLAERNAPTEVMVRRVKAYRERRYDGNLLDQVQGWGFQSGRGPLRYFRRGLFWSLRTFLKPWTVNPLRRDPPVLIDNLRRRPAGERRGPRHLCRRGRRPGPRHGRAGDRHPRPPWCLFSKSSCAPPRRTRGSGA